MHKLLIADNLLFARWFILRLQLSLVVFCSVGVLRQYPGNTASSYPIEVLSWAHIVDFHSVELRDEPYGQ
jgi:hypothetical protein